jgi:drug/metabolite transporter superfamily protein YnfA
MTDNQRKVARLVLALFSAFFVLPELIVGGYLFVSWFRTKTTDVYYVKFPYLSLAVVLFLVAALSLMALSHAARGRSFYGFGFAAPVFLGLCTMVVVPNTIPRGRSMAADANYLTATQASLRLWYESHQRFPRDKTELLDALRGGPPPWDVRSGHLQLGDSFYAHRGQPLPYEVEVVSNAAGPQLESVSKRPAVLYYSVRSDSRQFWITITSLERDLAPEATIKPVVLSELR